MTTEARKKPIPHKASAKQVDTLTPLLEHLQAIANAENAVSGINALIAAKRHDQEQLVAAIPKVDGLTKKREDLLANIALGGATDADLKSFDANCKDELAAHKQAADLARQAAEINEAAINGLQRKLHDAQEKLDTLRRDDRRLITNHLMNLAEAAGQEYVSGIQIIEKAYLRITALDNLLKTNNLKPSGLFGNVTTLNIPALNIPGCQELAHPNYQEWIFSDFLAYSSGDADRAIGDLRHELEEVGVTGL